MSGPRPRTKLAKLERNAALVAVERRLFLGRSLSLGALAMLCLLYTSPSPRDA